MSYNVTEIEEWIAHDPEESTAAEVRDLLVKSEGGDAEARAELEDRFQGSLNSAPQASVAPWQVAHTA